MGKRATEDSPKQEPYIQQPHKKTVTKYKWFMLNFSQDGPFPSHPVIKFSPVRERERESKGEHSFLLAKPRGYQGGKEIRGGVGWLHAHKKEGNDPTTGREQQPEERTPFFSQF